MTPMTEPAETSSRPRRIAQAIRLRHEARQQYLRLHASVWPEVEAMISAANIRNYTIYLLDDLLFSYYEYVGDDYDQDMARIAADPATQRWWRLTDPCQERLPGTPDDRQWLEVPEIWHMN
jgi:L-rhamnose mutarotase